LLPTDPLLVPRPRPLSFDPMLDIPLDLLPPENAPRDLLPPPKDFMLPENPRLEELPELWFPKLFPELLLPKLFEDELPPRMKPEPPFFFPASAVATQVATSIEATAMAVSLLR